MNKAHLVSYVATETSTTSAAAERYAPSCDDTHEINPV